MGRIVVGFDGSTESERALGWAVGEALRWQDDVLAVSAYSPSIGYVAYHPVAAEHRLATVERARANAEAALDEAINRVRACAGTVHIDREVVEATAGEALVTLSRDADLLVVGARGRGGLTGALLGSVGRQCVQHAHCPVVVIPAT